MLDRRKGVISPPESSFPQVLGELAPDERRDPRGLAALYIASTFPGTPLSLDESEACMRGDDGEILVEIGRALAAKLGREPSEVALVVWKTTRTICMNRGPLATGGRFVILRRHPHNVFESQFRVHFGRNNRRPFRFAAFRESYESAFRRIPPERLFELDYEEIPSRMGDLLGFLGHEDAGAWEGASSSLRHVAENRPWLAEILGDFESRDSEKRSRIDPVQAAKLDAALSRVRVMRPLMPALRRHFDRATLGAIRRQASQLLAR